MQSALCAKKDSTHALPLRGGGGSLIAVTLTIINLSVLVAAGCSSSTRDTEVQYNACAYVKGTRTSAPSVHHRDVQRRVPSRSSQSPSIDHTTQPSHAD